jgi:long-subunit acyl-CoA synthetase (AMP-forming)
MKFPQIDKIALQDETQSVSYLELNTRIDEYATKLKDVKCLAIGLDNSVEWVLWDLAAISAKVPCVPLPPFFTDEQRHHALQSAGATHIITAQGLSPTGIKYHNQLSQNTAKVTYTSGSTGTPKGVCLSLKAMENVACSISELLGKEFTGNHLSVLPLGVLLENVAGVYAALISGSTVTLPSLTAFDKQYAGLHEQLQKTKATTAILVPELLRALMMQVAHNGLLPDLKFIAVGGAKIDPALLHQAHAMGLPVYEGYGLSECASVVCMNTPNAHKQGTVGKPLPHISMSTKNDEIIIQNTGFLGYVGEAPAAEFATGDIGRIDSDGFVNITGRKKNIIINSMGRNISPEWVEAALYNHPVIAQAIVYGEAQPHLSALIVSMANEHKIQEAINLANNTLPDYAQIKDFQMVPPFTVEDGTLTGNGRPRRENILNLHLKKGEKDELLRSIG